MHLERCLFCLMSTLDAMSLRFQGLDLYTPPPSALSSLSWVLGWALYWGKVPKSSVARMHKQRNRVCVSRNFP